MPSADAIAALRSQIDHILQSPATPSGKRRLEKGRASLEHRDKPSDSTAPEVVQPIAASSDDAFKKIIALLNASEKSELMIRERLIQLEFPEASIETAIARAKEFGFIDDIRYGEVLIRSRISQGKGSAGIERELCENGIDPNDIPGYPEEFGIDADSEFERALDLLKRKPPHAKNARDAAYRKLVQKGFSTSTASSAARVWHDGR